LKLTEDVIKRLAPGADGSRRDYLDDGCQGLGVRVSRPRGKVNRIYFASYRVPEMNRRVRRRKRLGNCLDLSLEEARSRARRIRTRVDDGADPILEARVKKHRSTTVTELADRWVEAHRSVWRPATLDGWQRFLNKEILPAIGERAPAAVTREDVLAIVDRIKDGVRGPKGRLKRKAAPVSAARCFEVVRRMFRWAQGRGIVQASPCIGIETIAKAKKGTRVYSNDELRAIFAAVGGTQVDHLIPLIAHCATRSEETRSARWQDLDLEAEVWRIPAERSKTGDRTGNAHPIPLSAGALRVLASIRETNLRAGLAASPYLFPAAAARTVGPKGQSKNAEAARRSIRLNSFMDRPNQSVRRLAKAIGIEGLGLHNLRRTVATRLSEHGTPVHVIEHILGHTLPALIRTYQLHVPLKEMREALDWWSLELERLLAARAERA
jgi:integrase